MKPYLMRALLGALAIVGLAGCETRTATGGGLDDVDPVINLSTPGQDPDAINLSQPFSVQVSAGDNLSLLEVFVGVASGGTITASYDTVFSAATPMFVRDVPVNLTNAIAGQQITIVAVAEDGAGNFGSDTLVITVSDPSAPSVLVTAPPAGTIYRAGQALTISATATTSPASASSDTRSSPSPAPASRPSTPPTAPCSIRPLTRRSRPGRPPSPTRSSPAST